MITVSIVTTCKGRLGYLKESIPSWLAQELGRHIELDVIVSDFGCPDGTANWCNSLHNHRVCSVRAENNVEVFNLARARNIGGRASSSDFLAFVDADIMLQSDFVRKYVGTTIQNSAHLCIAGSVIEGARHTSSLCIVERKTFESVKGYDEAIEDYGEDDTDFYRRCDFYGAVRHWLEWDAEHHLCSDQERTRFYKTKHIQETIARNVAQTCNPGRAVNERDWGCQ